MRTCADNYAAMVENCQAGNERMSDFEVDFVDWTGTLLEDGAELSLKHIALLEKIWLRVTQ
jgi:hypothetical protein